VKRIRFSGHKIYYNIACGRRYEARIIRQTANWIKYPPPLYVYCICIYYILYRSAYTHRISYPQLSGDDSRSNNNNILLYYAHNIILYIIIPLQLRPLHRHCNSNIYTAIIYEFDRRIKGLCVFYCPGDTRLHAYTIIYHLFI